MKSLLLNFSLLLKRLKQKKYLRRILLINALLIVIVLDCIILWQLLSPRGVKSREEIVRLYLEAIMKKDYYEMQQLTPRDFDSKEAIWDEFMKSGGNRFENITTDFEELNGGMWYVLIKGERIDPFGKRLPFAHRLTLRVGQEDPYEPVYDPNNKSLTPKHDSWYLLLGKQKSSLLPVNSPPIKISP